MRACDRKSYARLVVCFTLWWWLAASASAQDAAAPSATGVVNLNRASLEELTRLPGIGPARARAVLELRTRLKRFERVEQLMRVRGIGRRTFRRLLPMLRLSGETTLPQRAQRRCTPGASRGT